MSDEGDDELARRVGAALLARDACSSAMGMELLEVRKGYSKVAMTIVPSMVSGLEMAHGGVIFTLADSAFAFACNSRNELNVALQCSISFHAAAKLGERLIAECRERSRTNRTGVYDIEVTGEGGRAIAFFRGVPYRLSGPTIAF